MQDLGAPTVVSSDPSTAARRPLRSRLTGLGSVLFGAYTVFAIVVLAVVWSLIAQDRESEQERQEAEISSLSRAFEEHVANSFGRVDLMLDAAGHLLDDFHSRSNKHSKPTDENLRARIANLFARTPPASAIAVTDLEENLSLNMREAGMPATVTPPPGQGALWQSNPNAPLRIGSPLALGRNDEKRWHIPVERGAASNGKLMGIVSALVNVRYFEQFYRDIRLTPQDSILLLSQDGRVLLQYPFNEREMGADFSSAPFVARAIQERTLVFRGRLTSDEEPRISVFRRLSEYPLIVAVSRPQEVALSNFREMQRRLVLGSAMLLGLLLTLVVLAYRDIRRREVDRAELRRINATLEARVGRRTAELEQTNRELLAFSYSISHDLRTPLRAINGFAHALREDYRDKIDEAGRDFLDRIYRASVRMGELIDELLSLANVSRQPLNFSEIDLSAIARDVAEDLQLTDSRRLVRFDIQPGMRTEGDEVLLRNALTNLLGNAWKFTRGRSPAFISVTARNEPDRQRFTVSDNGVGFDMAHAKRLFQPFQQLHSDQGYGGTGIGLASVRRVIERHGGRIWAESAPDRGARFVFELPKRVAVMRRRRVEKPG